MNEINISLLPSIAQKDITDGISSKSKDIIISLIEPTIEYIMKCIFQDPNRQVNQILVVTPLVKQSNMEKISTVAIMDAKKVKISSGPSIFFISNGDTAGEEVLKDEEIGGEVCAFGEAMAEQELSTKADDFIKKLL